ncbi:MAG: glutamate racemase [Paenibacillaceae bacterium]|jgi:glutamate racemase|nr:glutamate racemase [Paenibacillaceae bacterium]
MRPIAVLDSGVGGLTVVKQLLAELPGVPLVYVGDTARTPYGPRPAEEVRAFTEQIVKHLCTLDPTRIVIACNTATAVALDAIAQWCPVPVHGVIVPGARAAVRATRSGRIGVIGTEGTMRSRAYDVAIRACDARITVQTLACPAFVPLVEEGAYASDQARGIVEEVLVPMIAARVDTLILGCTHYPFLAPAIQQVMGSDVQLISSATEVAHEVRSHVGHVPEGTGVLDVSCTGEVAPFEAIVRRWLDVDVVVRHCVLPEGVRMD